ncbi:hypothetical protein Pan44_49540 [Caulifigura coniformis]|uniref:Uncharacterized protein n=1 Tax=Caulifigura coniformis TaxID=2527983 RepID=A0A517SL95_9PLAN|nr:hypothetical protein [Caulifigura coniformis]QDT56892.1 hypothetical protein Pan44_49540 [Caulifigura coniformis]
MALTVVTTPGDNGALNIEFSGTPVVGDNLLRESPGEGKLLRAYAFELYGAGTNNALYFKTGETPHFGGPGASLTFNVAGPAGGVVKPLNQNSWFSGGSDEPLALVASTTQPLFGSVQVKTINANGLPS